MSMEDLANSSMSSVTIVAKRGIWRTDVRMRKLILQVNKAKNQLKG
jgi:hypothetical protein